MNTLDDVFVKYPKILQVMEDAAIKVGKQIMAVYAEEKTPVDSYRHFQNVA